MLTKISNSFLSRVSNSAKLEPDDPQYYTPGRRQEEEIKQESDMRVGNLSLSSVSSDTQSVSLASQDAQ